MNQEVMCLSAGQNHIVLPLLPLDARWYQPGEGLLHQARTASISLRTLLRVAGVRGVSSMLSNQWRNVCNKSMTVQHVMKRHKSEWDSNQSRHDTWLNCKCVRCQPCSQDQFHSHLQAKKPQEQRACGGH